MIDDLYNSKRMQEEIGTLAGTLSTDRLPISRIKDYLWRIAELALEEGKPSEADIDIDE